VGFAGRVARNETTPTQIKAYSIGMLRYNLNDTLNRAFSYTEHVL